ncbi:hypothetical protein WJX84_008771 [Apatococcus fuscideae]|uniref:Serine hydrolase domain-containing protein n=1 Tax=Apatococcus fuscideae TaxID=2026836 RepID=A0AAW1T5Q5_9CHLO
MKEPWECPPEGERLRILCLHGFRQTGSSLKGRLSALIRRLKHRADLCCVDATFTLRPLRKRQSTGDATKQQGHLCEHAADAPDWVDGDQLMRQTEGWEDTLQHLLKIIDLQGPFNGVMGFSQGAGIAAAFEVLHVVKQHAAGHMVPSTRADADDYITFLDSVC